MKTVALLFVSASALGLSVGAPSALAQEHGMGTAAAEEFLGPQFPGFVGSGFSRLSAIAGRLDGIRDDYTGKAVRYRLAGLLAAQETAIGIRPDQMEAWRAYSEALLALIPDRATVVSLVGKPDEGPEGPEAFGRAEALSDALVNYADKARVLKQAITDLRAKLTSEQLEAARVPRLTGG